MWHMYTMEYCSVIKKNEIIPFVATNESKGFYAEWSKSDRGKRAYDIPYMGNPRRNDTNEFTKHNQAHGVNEWTYSCWG